MTTDHGDIGKRAPLPPPAGRGLIAPDRTPERMRLSMISAALVATAVGYGSTIALVLAAAAAVGADAAQTASWVAAVSVAKGLGSALLSWRTRIPVVLAWSTPGAALIAASSGVDIHEAVGAFLLAGGLIALTGAIPALSRAIGALPPAVAAAMLAGVLLPFVMAAARHAAALPALILPLVAIFLLARLASPLLAALATLAAGIAMGLLQPGAALPAPAFDPWPFVFVSPAFDAAVLVGLGVPLYLVTMASQNLPGFAVLRANGYTPPVRPALLVTGAGSAAAALWGAHTFNMAAITAAICLDPGTEPDPARRWRVGVVYGAFWVALGLLGSLILPAILALPPEIVATVAGLALIAPLMGAASQAFEPPGTRFAAAVTFATTASGVAAFGIGAAFWGLAAGLAVLALDRAASLSRSSAGRYRPKDAGSPEAGTARSTPPAPPGSAPPSPP
jgi:benzoate membrane transport protein